MSWAANKLIVTSSMTGYSEVEGIQDINKIPETKLHKGFILMPEGIDSSLITTSENSINSDNAVLFVSYISASNSTADANYDLFISLQNTIENLSVFAGWKQRAFIVKDKQQIGTLRFYCGIRTCN